MSKTDFCLDCKQYLNFVTINGNVYKHCLNCDKQYELSSQYILQYEYNTSKINNTRISSMINDKHTYPRCKKINMPNHKNCDNNIFKYYRDFETMNILYVCDVCKSYWT